MCSPAEADSPEAVIAAQQVLITDLRARIAELERQLGLNSGNSSKPPSSDGLKKKPSRISSLRERSGKKPGGQKGHPGKTLRRVETPDATVDHFPPTCEGCGAALSAAMVTGHTARQVFDLPEPRPLVVTEHRAHHCQCTACGAHTRAAFPQDVTAPVQYGARIAAFVVYLLHYQLLPEKRLADLMADLFGVHLVTATIAAMSRACASRFDDFAATVRDHVAAAAVKHLDETGFRIGGKTQWLHIASTIWLTFYRISYASGEDRLVWRVDTGSHPTLRLALRSVFVDAGRSFQWGGAASALDARREGSCCWRRASSPARGWPRSPAAMTFRKAFCFRGAARGRHHRQRLIAR